MYIYISAWHLVLNKLSHIIDLQHIPEDYCHVYDIPSMDNTGTYNILSIDIIMCINKYLFFR